MAKNGLKDKPLLRNFLWGIGFLVAMILVLQLALTIFTRHNRELTVPDFTALDMKTVNRVAKNLHLRTEIADSVFVRHLPLGVVFSQNPVAGSRVKKNRRIFITINSTVPRMVTVPSVIGYSLRQAQAELAANGLNVGKLTYVSDIATNNVLRQQYKGKDIGSGRKVETESKIDLVLGLNSEDNTTDVPNVKGFTYSVASANLIENSLNVGKVRYDDSVKNYADSLHAVVYSQSPAAPAHVGMGRSVDIYLTVDPEKTK
ncbi:MAG: PASTA domain-containing protein [Bacteroidales bacterium]|nr:PASTA domain-containing protein [Bacteroidales bacterium]